MKNLIFITTYITITLGNSLLFSASHLHEINILIYFTLSISLLFVFIGLTGYSKEMAIKMAEKENYSEMVRENLIPIYIRPVVGVSSAFIFFFFGYEIFAFFVLLASFGEVVLQHRVTSLLMSKV